MRFSFSGHETFTCKQYWLKKGLDYLAQGKKFTDDNAVVGLGVGKNMVTAIRFWLKAFGLVDEQDQPTEIAEFLFGESGVDPYLEDSASLWLLHYQLIKEKRSSIYDLIFNQFRYERTEFTKEQFEKFLNRKIEENGDSFSPKTIDGDIKVFLSNYSAPKKSDIEESFVGILQELNLIEKYQALNFDDKKVDWFRLNVSEKQDLPFQIILFSILENPAYGRTIAFRDLVAQPDAPGSLFLISELGLREKINEMKDFFPITFTETAGNQVLQFREEISSWDVLANYYGINSRK